MEEINQRQDNLINIQVSNIVSDNSTLPTKFASVEDILGIYQNWALESGFKLNVNINFNI